MVLVSLQVQLSVSNSTTSQNSLNSKTGLVCTSQFQAKSMSLYNFFFIFRSCFKSSDKTDISRSYFEMTQMRIFLTAFFWKQKL